MKKLILCAAALAIGTMGYAQVSGAPTADETKVVNNSADAQANKGLSIQTGDDNRVQVRQAGTNQSVYTEQSNGTGTGGNLARIRQTGDVTGLSGQLNAAEALQIGTDNQTTVYQGGDRNNAITRQGLTDNASANNKALVIQGTGEQSEDNFAAIDQDGSGNQASTTQQHDNSSAYTIQSGIDNKSMIVQNDTEEDAGGNEAFNEQYGERNESSINQRGAGFNDAYTIQEGNDNKAKQVQNTIAMAGGQGESAIINQGNQAAFALVGESLDGNNGNGNLYDALNTVDNVTNISQNDLSFGGIAFQTQLGKMNAAEIHQFGSESEGSNQAEQHQEGWNQDALIVQNAFGVNAGGGNYARQEQYDDNNEAAIAQNGINHKAFQYQDGKRNLALSTQRGTTGEGNLLNIHQFGNDNYATSKQRGGANATLIVQRGGQSFMAEQVGEGNQIDALQLGPNGNFATDGVDCSFDEPMDPTMDYTVPGFNLDDVCPGC
tara:strand:- start:34721 stop:36193 length:1473 start_codon:yes stop_codon:yes gene_type:complete